MQISHKFWRKGAAGTGRGGVVFGGHSAKCGVLKDSNTKYAELKLLTSTNCIYWIICTRQNEQNSVQKPVQAAWIQLLVSYMLSRGTEVWEFVPA